MKDPYPNERGCSWAKSRRWGQEQQRKERIRTERRLSPDLQWAKSWYESGYMTYSEYMEILEEEV